MTSHHLVMLLLLFCCWNAVAWQRSSRISSLQQHHATWRWQHRPPSTTTLHSSTSKHIDITVEHDAPSKKTRLDVYVSTLHSAYSRSFIGQLCDAGQIYVNNQPKSKSYKVSPGDQIQFEVIDTTLTTKQIQAENIPLDIIYEDEDIIAVNKANGMVVHPAPGTPNGTFVNALLYHIGQSAGQALIEHGQQRQQQQGASLLDPEEDLVVETEDVDQQYEEVEQDDNEDDEEFDDYEDEGYVDMLEHDIEETKLPKGVIDLPETPEAAKATPAFLRPGIVHRLDKGTTGVLLAGKHPLAVEKLSSIFAKRLIRKVYLAICVGYPGDTTIAEPIGRSTKNRQIMCVYDGPPGKPAVTHTKTIAFDGKLSVCLVRIETGRTHQIRVHLKERRTPILGDETYGNKDWNKRYQKSLEIYRPLLHAYETEFIHPFTKQSTILRAPIPKDIQALIDKISKNMVYSSSPDFYSNPTPSSNPSANPSHELYDAKTKLLLGSTEVLGKRAMFVDSASNSMKLGGTPIHSSNHQRKSNGYVPLDRIKLEEDDWTSYELPEDPSFFK